MRALLGTPRKKSVADDAGTADHTGWLYKEGEHNKDFRRRFFVLHGQSLAYYKDEADVAKGSRKGDLTIAALVHIHSISKEAGALEANTVPLCFAVDAASGRRYILFAETFSDKVGWMRMLSKALGRRSGAARARLEVYIRDMTTGPSPDACGEEEGGSASEGGGGGSSGGGEGEASGATAAAAAPPPPRWAALTEGMDLVKHGQSAAAQVSFDRALTDAASGKDAACEVCVRYELGKFLVTQVIAIDCLGLPLIASDCL